jgi:hypothetical protein
MLISWSFHARVADFYVLSEEKVFLGLCSFSLGYWAEKAANMGGAMACPIR